MSVFPFDSITTDGTASNVSLVAGLFGLLLVFFNWLVTTICSCHAGNLAFKDTLKSIQEFADLFTDLRRTNSYWRGSSVRTHEFQQKAKEMKVNYLQWPKFKETRFVPFFVKLMKAFHRNFPVCICVWKDRSQDMSLVPKERESASLLLSLWSRKRKLRIFYFALDIFCEFSSLSRRFERNELFLHDVPDARDKFLAVLRSMDDSPKVGGWESSFVQKVGDGNRFRGCDLSQERARRSNNQLTPLVEVRQSALR